MLYAVEIQPMEIEQISPLCHKVTLSSHPVILLKKKLKGQLNMEKILKNRHVFVTCCSNQEFIAAVFSK